MISIIIPSFNNLKYLKLCIQSLEKNSHYKNEILIHVNEGSDNTVAYLESRNIQYTHSIKNIGLCKGCNQVAKKSRFDYILYSHDDMYFLPDWDLYLMNKVKSIDTNKFYFSSIMINGDPKLRGHLDFFAGETIENFDEKKLLENYKNLEHEDFQGSTWAPHLIHKELWNKIGGFSEEFSPGAGSDPDLNMKLWNEGVRTFQCISNSRVYHFGSVTIRKKGESLFKKNQGSFANKIFLMKWGISIRTFKRFYLRSNYLHNNPLTDPEKNLSYYFNILKDKISIFYYNLFLSINKK